jgi:hypothetical protein
MNRRARETRLAVPAGWVMVPPPRHGRRG